MPDRGRLDSTSPGRRNVVQGVSGCRRWPPSSCSDVSLLSSDVDRHPPTVAADAPRDIPGHPVRSEATQATEPDASMKEKFPSGEVWREVGSHLTPFVARFSDFSRLTSYNLQYVNFPDPLSYLLLAKTDAGEQVPKIIFHFFSRGFFAFLGSARSASLTHCGTGDTPRSQLLTCIELYPHRLAKSSWEYPLSMRARLNCAGVSATLTPQRFLVNPVTSKRARYPRRALPPRVPNPHPSRHPAGAGGGRGRRG